MSSSNRDDVNPYLPPAESAQAAYGVRESPPDPTMVKKFRQQIHALGAFWIIIGSLAIMATVFALAGSRDLIDLGSAGAAFALVAGVTGTAWCVLGVLTCLKHLWAVYVGLVLSYLSLFSQLLSLSLCPLVILIIVVLQAHRVIGWANRMQAAGVPLTTKP